MWKSCCSTPAWAATAGCCRLALCANRLRADATLPSSTPPHAHRVAARSAANALARQPCRKLTDSAQSIPLTALQRAIPAQRIAAAAGIGHPERFFQMLRDAGLSFEAIALPDHFDFNDYSFSATAADLILITEKDAVKCRHIAALRDDPRLWVVPVSAQLDDALAERIMEKLRGYTTA